MPTQAEIAALGTPEDVRSPGDNVWRAFDPSSPPEPGTQVRVRQADGTLVLTTYNGPDDFSAPLPTTKATTPSRNASPSDYPTPEAYAKDPVAAAGQFYTAVLADPTATAADRSAALTELTKAQTAAATASGKTSTLDATTRALSASYDQVVQAGGKPTQAEIVAHNQATQANGTGGGGSLSGDLQKYGAEVTRITGNQAAGQFAMAQALHETGGGKTWPVGANGPESATYNYAAWGGVGDSQGHPGYASPEAGAQAYVNWIRNNSNYAATWQAMSGGGSLQDIANTFATTSAGRWAESGQQSDGTNPSYAQAVLSAAGQLGSWGTGAGSSPSNGSNAGLASLGLTPPNPDVRNFGSSTAPNWRQYDPKSGQWAPVSGANIGEVTAPDVKYGTNPDGSKVPYQWDAASNSWQPARGLPADAAPLPTGMVNVQQVMANWAQNVQFIKDQAKAGAFGTDPASAQQQMASYLGSAAQIRDAALQGATPLDLQKQATANAQIGKDLIDQRLQSGASLANSLMSSTGSLTGLAGYNPVTLASRMGWLPDDQGVQDQAKALLGGLTNPNGAQAVNATPSGPATLTAPPPPAPPSVPHPFASALMNGLNGSQPPDIAQLLNEGPQASDVAAKIANGMGAGGIGPPPGSLGAQQQIAANVMAGKA